MAVAVIRAVNERIKNPHVPCPSESRGDTGVFLHHVARVLSGFSILVEHHSVALVDEIGHGTQSLVYLCDLERQALLIALDGVELQIVFSLIRDSSVVGCHVMDSILGAF